MTAEQATYRRVITTMRRQCTVNGKRAALTLPPDAYGARANAHRTTVGAIAASTKLSVPTVAALLGENPWVVLERDDAAPPETWGVIEDGE